MEENGKSLMIVVECDHPSHPGRTTIRYGPIGVSFALHRSLERYITEQSLQLKVEGLTNQSDEKVEHLIAGSRSIRLMSSNPRHLVLDLKICDKLLLDPSNKDAHLIELFFEDKGKRPSRRGCASYFIQ